MSKSKSPYIFVNKEIHYDSSVNFSFQKPMFCVDMHIHTKYSDGLSRVEKVLSVAKKKGIGIAITDHNEIRGSLYAKRLIEQKREYSGIFLVPGIEVTVRGNVDVLVYFSTFEELELFYVKVIKPHLFKYNIFTRTKLELSEFLSSLKDYDSLVILAHPFALKGLFCSNVEVTKEMMKQINGFEVINSGIPTHSNLKIIRWYDSFTDKSFTAGSDSHYSKLIGTALTYVNKPGSVSDFLDAVRNRKNHVVGKTVKIRSLITNHLFLYRFFVNFIKHSRIQNRYDALKKKN